MASAHTARGASSMAQHGTAALTREPFALSAVALDLDGTLLRSDKTVSDATVAALQRLAAQGVLVILATGRMTPTVLPVEARLGLPLACPLVTYNGACAYGPAGAARHRLFHRPLPCATADAVLRWCDAHGVAVNVYLDDRILIHADPRFRGVAERYRRMTACVYETFDSYAPLMGSSPTKLLVFCDDGPEAVGALYDRLAAVVPPGSAHLIRAEFFVEVLVASVNKGVGLAGLAKALELPLSRIAAFGDGENDAEFLAAAGLGIAMCNGHARAKEAARMVTEHSNDSDGVVRCIEALLATGGATVAALAPKNDRAA